MKHLLPFLILLSSCTTYPKFEYTAIDNKGKKLIVHEHKGAYTEHRHDKGDTVVIYNVHGAFGLISPMKYDGRRLNYKTKNVIIIEKK